jgi:hypothetical protein
VISFRHATAADIDRYYGERPQQTLKALTILLDDEPVAIIGLALEGDRFQAFSEFKPELEPHLKTMPVLRAIKTAQKMIAAAPLPVVAISKGDPTLLKRLGFHEVREGVYLWPR